MRDFFFFCSDESDQVFQVFLLYPLLPGVAYFGQQTHTDVWIIVWYYMIDQASRPDPIENPWNQLVFTNPGDTLLPISMSL